MKIVFQPNYEFFQFELFINTLNFNSSNLTNLIQTFNLIKVRSIFERSQLFVQLLNEVNVRSIFERSQLFVQLLNEVNVRSKIEDYI